MTALPALTRVLTVVRRVVCCASIGAAVLATGTAWAQTAPANASAPEGSPESWVNQAQQWVQQQIQEPAGSRPAKLRPEIVVGQLDSRLRLAPCQRVEPFLPEGTRLWGRTRVGLRCAEGPTRWTVFLPITVKAWGPPG